MNFQRDKLEYDEIEINIERIIESYIKNWKCIVISALLFAILLPSIIYIKSFIDNVTSKKENDEIEVNEISMRDQVQVDAYWILKDAVDSLRIRGEENPVLQLDYDMVYQGCIYYYVDSESDKRADLVEILSNYVSSQEFANEFYNKESGINLNYVSEIIIPSNLNTYENTGGFRIYFMAADENECKRYMTVVNEIMFSYSEKLKTDIEDHTLKILQEEIISGFNDHVYSEQRSHLTELDEEMKYLESHESELSDTQKAIINSMNDDSMNDENVENQTLDKSSRFEIKYLLLGGIFGMIAGSIFVFMKTVFNGKLQSEEELCKRFNITNLGTLYCEESVKNGGFIHSKNKDYNLDKQIEFIVKHIKRNNSQKVCFITSLNELNVSEIDYLKSKLEKNGIKCFNSKNIISYKDMVEVISEISNVIWVEKIGESKIKEIYQEAKLSNEFDMHVMGYISIYN